MAHIPDGVLSLPVLATGVAMTAAGVTIGLRRLPPERIPQVAVLSAVLFVAALVHFPVGPSSVHLILNGLAGVLLGWAAFPALLVALLLQVLMFGFGGFVVLGVNAMNMALPAVVCGLLFRWGRQGFARSARAGAIWAGLLGGFGVLLTAVMVAASLGLSGREFVPAAQLVLLTHLPVMVVEGFVTAAAVGLMLRVRPEMLGPTAPALAASAAA